MTFFRAPSARSPSAGRGPRVWPCRRARDGFDCRLRAPDALLLGDLLAASGDAARLVAGVAAEIRAELQVEPAGHFMRRITWQGATVATLSAAANDGSGPWSVGPHKPADDSAVGVEWAAGKTLAAATRKGLNLVAKRLAQDLARDVDPTGPGGFAGPSITEPERPELSAAGDDWRLSA